MLKVNSLACERGERLLFKNVSFTVQAGQIFQLTGVNGAGKSSLLRLVAGLGQPYAGSIHWQGRSLDKPYGKELCYIEHANGLKDSLSTLENLALINCLLGIPSQQNIAKILERLGLEDYANTLVEHLSAGQKRRLALAKLLLSSAKLWILDEPFTSLDSKSVALIESLLAAHCQQQGIAVIATHQPLSLSSAVIINYELVPC